MIAKTRKIKRLGVLGGTFDPPHVGHLSISNFAIKKLKLSLLIWAVTKKNPLKRKPYLSLSKRIKLSKKKLKNNKKIKVKSFDKIIKSTKTIDLIKYVKKDNKAKIFFIMGADSLVNFHKWHKWKEIANLCKIVVFPRNNYMKKVLTCKAVKTLKKEKILFIRTKKINISSSKIRKNYLKYSN